MLGKKATNSKEALMNRNNNKKRTQGTEGTVSNSKEALMNRKTNKSTDVLTSGKTITNSKEALTNRKTNNSKEALMNRKTNKTKDVLTSGKTITNSKEALTNRKTNNSKEALTNRKTNNSKEVLTSRKTITSSKEALTNRKTNNSREVLTRHTNMFDFFGGFSKGGNKTANKSQEVMHGRNNTGESQPRAKTKNRKKKNQTQTMEEPTKMTNQMPTFVPLGPTIISRDPSVPMPAMSPMSPISPFSPVSPIVPVPPSPLPPVGPAPPVAQAARSPNVQPSSQLGSAGLPSTGPPINEEISRQISHHIWYHGMMPRDAIEDLLKNNGDFLVRRTDVSGKIRFAISVVNTGRIRHILLNYKEVEKIWSIRERSAPTIDQLIDNLVATRYQVQTDGTILVTAVPRPEYYILHEQLVVKERLGGGAFGDVHIGTRTQANGQTDTVAIKKLKGVMHKKERKEFVKEACLMRKLKHPNLVCLIGVAPNESPMMIVLELCPGGSLQSHLKKNQTLPPEKLMQYAVDACRGLCYLSYRRVIHRDVAARNCLLGKNDEVKISDFGLSVANTNVLKLDKLKQMPIRWLSPETLKKGEFSTKSDVWSYGVMMWEIFTYCKTDPFPGQTNAQARAKIISGSDPMDPPEKMPLFMISVMKLCFSQDSNVRPDFETLLRILSPREPLPPKEDEAYAGLP